MQSQANSTELIAQSLLEVNAVFLRPQDMFTWSSGIKSPIYCDNRITLAYPELRNSIRDYFINLINSNFPQADLIAGVATAGIPQAAIIADHMNLPLAYVRSKNKDHGRTNLIEGQIKKGAKAIVIEDLISTGGSSINAIENLQAAGVEVLGLLAIFSYNLPLADKQLAALGIPVHSLSNYDVLIKIALKKKLINENDFEVLNNWRSTLITNTAS